MDTSVRRPFVFDSYSLRSIARASAAVLIVIWLALLSAEALSANTMEVHLTAIYQVAALAIIFAGYVVSSKHELAGGSIAIFGTIVFFAVNFMTLGVFPPVEAALFAAPGLLCLMAWYSDKVRGASQARQP